jgi:hypothetical protein
MNTNIAPAEYRECFKCWYRGITTATQCPRCGRVLRTSENIRKRGVAGIVVGLFLVVFMIAIAVGVTVLLEGAMKDPASARKINAGSTKFLAIYGLFALVALFGVNSIVIGTFFAITGRRSRILIWVMWGLLFTIFVAGTVLREFIS